MGEATPRIFDRIRDNIRSWQITPQISTVCRYLEIKDALNLGMYWTDLTSPHYRLGELLPKLTVKPAPLKHNKKHSPSPPYAPPTNWNKQLDHPNMRRDTTIRTERHSLGAETFWSSHNVVSVSHLLLHHIGTTIASL